MKRKTSPKSTTPKEGLVIRPGGDAPLSRTQLEFNRLMKSLEATKVRHEREQVRLDVALDTAIRELMPLVEDLNRVDRDLILKGRTALETFNLNAQRRLWFGDLLVGKAHELLADPVGLSDEDVREIEAIIEELSPPENEEELDEEEREDFNFMRMMVENAARKAGLELDLSDLDPNCDPAEFERIVRERLDAASTQFHETAGASTTKPARKPTKAQAAKERARLAQEEAKNRDLKSLFKQLAKAFHPDLEPDPLLRQHKQIWMQRLNTAYAANDLREMLQLEMEWLGEEATNLATAGDEKLQVYCMVLKEQIADLKRQTQYLPDAPQYGPLQRFRDPYGNVANPATAKRRLRESLRRYQTMLDTLAANKTAARRMVYEWADEHAFRSTSPF
jgi:hypothetical protein